MPSKPFAQSCSDHFFKILHCPSLFYPFFKVYFICGSSFNLLYLVKKQKKRITEEKRVHFTLPACLWPEIHMSMGKT